MQLTDPLVQNLKEAARRASLNAYCPYSRFPVGAAVLTESGEIYAGANVENASYGLTLCAERNAVAQAIAAGNRQILAVAVFTPTPSPTPPCGACRQVIAEFGSQADVFGFSNGPEVFHARLDRLLPEAPRHEGMPPPP